MMKLKKLKKCRRLGRADSGTAMIEFALSLPILTFLFLGLVEIGGWAPFAILAQAAAWSGANYGAWNLITAADSTGMNTWTAGSAQYLPAGYTYTTGHVCSVKGAQPPTTCPSFAVNPPSNTVYYIKVTVKGTYKPLVTIPQLPGFAPLPAQITVQGISYRQVATQ